MSEKAISKKKTVRFWTVEFSRCGSKRVAHRTEFFGIIHMYHLCGWQGDQLSFLHLLCTDLPFISKQVFSFFQPFPNFRQVLVTFELRKAHLTTWLGETMYVSVGYDPELETHPLGCQKYNFSLFCANLLVSVAKPSSISCSK